MTSKIKMTAELKISNMKTTSISNKTMIYYVVYIIWYIIYYTLLYIILFFIIICSSSDQTQGTPWRGGRGCSPQDWRGQKGHQIEEQPKKL